MPTCSLVALATCVPLAFTADYTTQHVGTHQAHTRKNKDALRNEMHRWPNAILDYLHVSLLVLVKSNRGAPNEKGHE
jgi:hypothetical protein